MLRLLEEVATEDARAYGRQAYAQFREAECPGAVGHESRGTSAEYCSACVQRALTRAFEEGARWQLVKDRGDGE